MEYTIQWIGEVFFRVSSDGGRQIGLSLLKGHPVPAEFSEGDRVCALKLRRRFPTTRKPKRRTAPTSRSPTLPLARRSPSGMIPAIGSWKASKRPDSVLKNVFSLEATAGSSRRWTAN